MIIHDSKYEIVEPDGSHTSFHNHKSQKEFMKYLNKNHINHVIVIREVLISDHEISIYNTYSYENIFIESDWRNHYQPMFKNSLLSAWVCRYNKDKGIRIIRKLKVRG